MLFVCLFFFHLWAHIYHRLSINYLAARLMLINVTNLHLSLILFLNGKLWSLFISYFLGMTFLQILLYVQHPNDIKIFVFDSSLAVAGNET